jgi:hypothetical protein
MHHGLGDLSMANKTKQNKLPSLIDRLMRLGKQTISKPSWT